MEKELSFLVVEDDPIDAYSVRRILTKTGLGKHVDTAFSLEQAKQKILLASYDAVILDLGLPDSQGVDGIIDFQASAPELPIIVLTGNQDEKTALRGIDIGAEDFIDKDTVTEAGLSRSIRFAIERHRRKRQVFGDMHQLRTSLGEARQKSSDDSPSVGAEVVPFPAEDLVLQVQPIKPFTLDGITGNRLTFSLGPVPSPMPFPAIHLARKSNHLAEMTLHCMEQAQAWRQKMAPACQLHLDIEADAVTSWLCTEMNRVFKGETERQNCILYLDTDFSSLPGEVSHPALRLLRQSGFQIGARNMGGGASVLENLLLLSPQWIRFHPSLTLNVSRYKKKAESLKVYLDILRPLGAHWAADETEGEEDLRQLLEFGFSAHSALIEAGVLHAL